MRVLIATVTAGAGHLQAAAALEEAWRAMRPGDLVGRVDVLDFVPRIQKQAYAHGYMKFVAHAPELWGMIFRRTDNPAFVRKLTRVRRSFARHSNTRFVRHVRVFKPDVVICTHYLPVEIFGHLESTGRDSKPFTVCVVTDFEAHALWMDSCVQLYCVAAEETKARLVARGAAEESVAVTGIPIAARFSSRPDAKSVRKAYGIRDDMPVMLVLSGGFGMGPVEKILKELDKIKQPFHTLVVAGRNEELRRDLSCQDRKHPTQVLGFVTNMQELMAVSDIIVTKPGGLTSSEALALGKPLFILDPIPGQEAANSDFLLERGAAAKVNRVEDLPFRLERLLGSNKLDEMARAARALGKPGAATDICRETLRHMKAAR